ncbi:TPA: hypothetical protein RJ184_001736 [Mannheimia haemolytica]|nr:hypothetical protein [Mannheimia haemolytica]
MADHSQFISRLENRIEPKISFQELIQELSNYTNKPFSHIADKLKSLIFSFQQNGIYTNAFVNCTLFEDGESYAIEPKTLHFKDAFDQPKGVLSDVIAQNSIDVEHLNAYYVTAREITQLIKAQSPTLLDKLTTKQTQSEISQIQNDYISVYDFIEWASKHYSSLSETANDLNRLLKDKNIQLYRQYGGISPSIDKDNTNLKAAFDFVAINNGYEKQSSSFNFDDDIPF